MVIDPVDDCTFWYVTNTSPRLEEQLSDVPHAGGVDEVSYLPLGVNRARRLLQKIANCAAFLGQPQVPSSRQPQRCGVRH